MDLPKHTALILLWILGVTYAQDIYLAAPSSLRLNDDENIAIAVDGARGETVNIVVQDYPGKRKTIFKNDVVVQPGQPIISKIKLDVEEFPPDFLTSPVSPKLVILSTFIQGSRRELIVPITSQSGYMFIQTDKPIYTPKERVSFRIIPLTEEGLPSSGRFKLQIKDPEGIVVDEKFFNEKNRRLENYFATHSYKFAKYPRLGDWSAVVRFGKNLEQNSSASFELQEYVLPTFTVTLKTPDVILETQEEIVINVEAKYVYGEKVNGIVSFRFGVQAPRMPNATYFSLRNSKALVDGALQVRLSTNDLKTHKSIGWFPKIKGSTFVVEATVVDVATGDRMVETDSRGRFSKSPFLISFKRCLSDFKPGLRSVFEADITYVDGKPAVGITTKLSAVANNGLPLNIIQSTSISNENGRVSFELHPEIHHTTVTLTLETTQQGYAGSQAKGTYIQRAYTSGNRAYIAISRSTPLRLRPGDMFRRDIYLEPSGIHNIYYLVVARGKISKIGKLPPGQYKVQRFEFPITHEMVPNFRVVVFAHYGHDLVADSLRIDIEKICSPNAEVTLEPQFVPAEPGHGGKIIIRGAKDTAVGLLGVDEAVYALSKRDLLTKEKMFDRLVSHDLGCGPGGGLNINAVLGNAGITILTNKFTTSHTHSCVEIKRRKRSLAVDIVNRYAGKEKACCGVGLQPDKRNKDCQEKFFAAEKKLDEIHENCSSIFLACCMEAEEAEVIGHAYIPEGVLRGVGENFDVLRVLNDDMDDDFERQTTVRKDFRETWMNLDFLIGSDRKKELDISLPHTITTWVIQAVSLSPTEGMCVAEPKKVVSFKKIFLKLSLPYSVKQFEQVEIQATVFNYEDKDITAYVTMYGIEGVCSGTESGAKSEKQKLEIKRKSAKMATFSLIPLKVEDIPIKFYAQSAGANDIVEKILHVVPQGVREEKNAVIRLDPTNRQKRPEKHIDEKLYSDLIEPTEKLQVTTLKLALPEGTIPGTTRCLIKATGDIVGPAVETSLKNPDSLIKAPSGCGEQTMLSLAPTVYTMKYLKSVDKLTTDRRNKGYGFIRAGYDNQMKYKKKDGSYAAWPGWGTSTWLTAFVLKVFCQGTEIVPIDEKVISTGLRWLRYNQKDDGSYIEKHRVYHKEMMGGVDGTVSMTAFVLITLAECSKRDQSNKYAIESALDFLEYEIDEMNKVHFPLPAAILAYALALTNSTKKHAANDKLLGMARYDLNNNYMYWNTKNSAQDIETAGYALLAQLTLNDMDRSTSIVNWLNTKQLQSGQFKSTQDTVIALQALSEYAIKAAVNAVNMVSNITSSSNKEFQKVFTFNKDNALEVQSVEIEEPEGMLFVKTTGYGMGTLSMKLEYSVLKPEQEICKFDIKIDAKSVQNTDNMIRGVMKEIGEDPAYRRRRQVNKDEPIDNNLKNNKDLSLNINICLRYLGEEETEMSIADVGIFSGFKPVDKDLEEIEKDPKHFIQKFEKLENGIIFYLDKIPRDKDYCFSFQVYREYIVTKTQSSIVKVYDYYNPDAVCTKFYSPDGNSPLISTICDGGVCECAEGGCPAETPFADIMKENHRSTRREKMTAMFCDDFDYVWKGKLKGRAGKSGKFLNVSFEILEVIKPGVEKEEDLQNKVRFLRAQSHCKTAYLLSGATYLVMGKDPPPREEGDLKYYKYLLDKSSIIHPWSATNSAESKSLRRDLEYVTDELKTKGCAL